EVTVIDSRGHIVRFLPEPMLRIRKEVINTLQQQQQRLQNSNGTGASLSQVSSTELPVGKEVLDLTNDFRQENRCLPLKWSDDLCAIAFEHSKGRFNDANCVTEINIFPSLAPQQWPQERLRSVTTALRTESASFLGEHCTHLAKTFLCAPPVRVLT